MNVPTWKGPPQRSEGDALHEIVRAALGLAGSPAAADLFTFLFRPPFERRTREWMERVEMQLTHLAQRDRELVARLPSNEAFASVFMAASQAAARTHSADKQSMLASAVGNSAAGVDVSADFQVLFVRFIDELTTTHVRLLSLLVEYDKVVAGITAFAYLKAFFVDKTGVSLRDDEFKLLCNDLEARVLVRLSESIEDFGGLAIEQSIGTETSGGKKVMVTRLGEDFLRFVTSGPSLSR